jgi:hypothetical protein
MRRKVEEERDNLKNLRKIRKMQPQRKGASLVKEKQQLVTRMLLRHLRIKIRGKRSNESVKNYKRF